MGNIRSYKRSINLEDKSYKLSIRNQAIVISVMIVFITLSVFLTVGIVDIM